MGKNVSSNYFLGLCLQADVSELEEAMTSFTDYFP